MESFCHQETERADRDFLESDARNAIGKLGDGQPLEELAEFRRSPRDDPASRRRYRILFGSDIYRDLSPTRKRQSATAARSLNDCDGIILLQPLMARNLKAAWKKKSSVVLMDVPKVKAPSKRRSGSTLNVCVVGHLRYEKDPLRAAMAVRKLPRDVSINVTHAGQALFDSLQHRADRESSQNANWNWLGSVDYGAVQRLMRSSDILVNSSRSEGAPNVLFEAISWRLPIIASRIDGHVGVLGRGPIGGRSFHCPDF